jgi:diguanylate cyclase (GGDEF)-like protein/PAS domain S-box-containing protein
MSNQVSLLTQVCCREDSLVCSTLDHAIYMLDATGAISNWSPGALNMKGYAADEVIGTHFSFLYTPEDRENGEPERSLRCAVELGHYKSKGWRVRKDGSRFWASIAINPIYEGTQLVGFAQVTRDISRQHQAEEQLALANHHLKIALASMWRGLALYDSAGRLILANRRLSEIFSISPDRLHAGMNIADAMRTLGFSCDRAKQMNRQLNLHHASDPPYMFLHETKCGRIISITIERTPEGERIAVFEDVTERQSSNLKLEDQASYDPLTGLANRTFFRRRLAEAIARTKRGIPFALLVLDIKDFDSINDALGEAFGDDLLKSVGHRIKHIVREVDTVARLDGDAFAVLQCNPDMPKGVEALASRLMECISVPHHIDGQSVIVSVNLGIALGTSDGSESDVLLKNADMALSRARQSPVPCYSFFNSEIDLHLKARRALKTALYEASRRGEFALHYQPIADAQTGQIKGFEALLRWFHPDRGWVSPAEFVPAAEECGLIVSLGAWALRTACAQAASWPSDWRVAVNLSAVQFRDGLLQKTVAHALEMAGLEPHRLELEVTESVLLKDDDANLATLSQLREMGIHVSLDDFGTGYSSLSYLRSFRFDKLKIDRSFIQDLPHSDSARAIVNSVIGLGKSFGISLVAEGVETQEQLQYLQLHGCDEVQGYLLGHPRPPEELWNTRSPTVDGNDNLKQDSMALARSHS